MVPTAELPLSSLIQPPHASALYHDPLEAQSLLPLIDLGLLSQGNEAEVQKLVVAAKEWGFLQVANHGVPAKLVAGIEEQACQAFALPVDAKKRSSAERTPLEGYFGYMYGSQPNHSYMRWSEALRIPSDSQLRAGVISKLWPEGNEAFSFVVGEYIAASDRILMLLLRNLAIGLGIDPLQFTQDLSKHESTRALILRMNFYPTSPDQDQLPLAPNVGLEAHTDPHLLTLLHQNDVDGLQILKDGKWIPVKPRAGCFVVNVGDALQVMSNDIYTSVIHRVEMKRDRFRMSVACALPPHPEAFVRPALELVTEHQPSHYRPFKLHEYYLSLRSLGVGGRTALQKFRTVSDHEQPNMSVKIQAAGVQSCKKSCTTC